MDIFLIILLIAASPIIIIYIFFEVMAAREGSEIQDGPRKFSKALAWLIFGLISIFLLYIAITDSPAFHLRQVLNFISAGFEFLK
ncbi:MAG: hypothetical protein CVU35_01720 [Betaproteobacteria bacterium HGW-Betaproteobacteria-8]|nr:MAG: hypothetical protein CVU35_01720 [Betaproteobacteria bacterium HGW-Betaproteobacteria-8]